MGENTDEINNSSLENIRENLKNKYGETFGRIEKIYKNTWDNTLKNTRTYYELNKIFKIIVRYEHYTSYFNYQLNDNDDIYNFHKFYRDYYKEISKDKNTLFNDLLFLYRIGFIDIFSKYNGEIFFKRGQSGYLGNPYLHLFENLCKLYNNIENGKCQMNAILYLTAEGDRYRNGKFLEDMISDASKQQDNLAKKLIDLNNRIDAHTKEIISIVAIILALAPLITTNVSLLKDFSLKSLLIVNGCLLISISTIFTVITIAFFELKKKHWWLAAPIVIGILIILLSIKYYKFLT
ncbi:hypothetical protein [Clostridium guangxiense]|uniref:hypothetical protein n=1 Tax=Clostridium guangxiense TaxID=1662055 RepID=UPI001E383CCF|nr:hypothetical protein [Clostridium guangxiense]MCD2347177.1 hypothetical protein [Clostridium guangxiense]